MMYVAAENCVHEAPVAWAEGGFEPRQQPGTYAMLDVVPALCCAAIVLCGLVSYVHVAGDGMAGKGQTV